MLRFSLKNLLKLATSGVLAAVMTVGQAAAGAESGELFLSSGITSVTVGQTVNVQVRESSGDVPLNAVQANVTYDSNHLKVKKIDTTGSPFSINVGQSDNGSVIAIALGLEGEGVRGTQNIATIQFDVVKEGSVTLGFGEGSALIKAADGTALTMTTTPITLTIKPGTLSPSPSASPTGSPEPTDTPEATATPEPEATESPEASPTATPMPATGAGSDTAAPLPDTGAEALGGAVGLGALAYAGRAWYLSRHQLRTALRSKRPQV